MDEPTTPAPMMTTWRCEFLPEPPMICLLLSLAVYNSPGNLKWKCPKGKTGLGLLFTVISAMAAAVAIVDLDKLTR